jgi:hypothetical protein
MIHPAKWIWVGPASDDAVQEDFMRFWGRTCELSGDVYFTAPKKDIEAMAQTLAISRKHLLPDNFKTLDMLDYLPLLVAPFVMNILGEYDQKAVGRGAGTALLANLEQRPKFSALSKLFPVVDTHALIYSYNMKRVATPCELLFAQGVPIFSPQCDSLRAVLSTCTLNNVRMLAGNSMHVPSMTCWIMYVLANIKHVSEFSQLGRSLGNACGSAVPVSEEDSDEE